MKRLWGSLVLTIAGLLAFTGVAEAAFSVSYTSNGSVWLSSLDGKQKRKLAAKPRGKEKWIETAQSDNGRVIAVKRDPAKISNLNSYSLWAPTGKRITVGSLTAEPGWTSYVMPLSLDLTSNGRTVVYGFQNFTYNFPVSNIEQGTYVKSADRGTFLQPIKITGQEWPTTVGNRIVAEQQNALAGVQKASNAPYGSEFSGWFSVESLGLNLQRTDVSANKRVAAAELDSPSNDDRDLSVILVSKVNGLGGAIGQGGCLLPAKGQAENASLSQDGKWIAWEDNRGVVVAGIPTFGGSEVCKMTRPVKVIARGGTFPSIGSAKVAVKRKPKRR